MSTSFVGHVIKSDRIKLGLTQKELQRRVLILSAKHRDQLSKKEKQALIDNDGYPLTVNGQYIWSAVTVNLISKIERGIAREVLKFEFALIAEVLGVDVEKYLELEINPLKLIGKQAEPVIEDQTPFLERAIEFEPEYRQAGISILSFFSELVEREFSGQAVKVGIMQNGNMVTLRVETPEGDVLKEVEKALNQYGLAVMGSAPIDSVSSNPQLVQDLKTRLEVTNLELKLRRESTIEQSKQYETRISSLEGQIKGLHKLVGENLVQQNGLVETIRALSNSTQPTDAFLNALSIIAEISSQKKSIDAEKRLEESFKILEKETPGLLSRLATTIEGIPASVSANLASSWIQTIILSMPK